MRRFFSISAVAVCAKEESLHVSRAVDDMDNLHDLARRRIVYITKENHITAECETSIFGAHSWRDRPKSPGKRAMCSQQSVSLSLKAYMRTAAEAGRALKKDAKGRAFPGTRPLLHRRVPSRMCLVGPGRDVYSRPAPPDEGRRAALRGPRDSWSDRPASDPCAVRSEAAATPRRRSGRIWRSLGRA